MFSDIHSNLEALSSVEDAISREKVDHIFSVGDIVGYGADPARCIKKTKEITKTVICGNHDAAVIGTSDARFFNSSARKAVFWTKENLSEKECAFLQKLKLSYKNKDLTLVHGTLHEPEQFHYMLDLQSAYMTFSLMKTRVCFVGHTHVPGIFALKSDEISYITRGSYSFGKDEKIIVNAGSVGQPRDGDPRAAYCIYDTDKSMIEIKRCGYDIQAAQKKIVKAGLPEFLAERLAEGV